MYLTIYFHRSYIQYKKKLHKIKTKRTTTSILLLPTNGINKSTYLYTSENTEEGKIKFSQYSLTNRGYRHLNTQNEEEEEEEEEGEEPQQQ
jgi:hypothetical protein